MLDENDGIKRVKLSCLNAASRVIAQWKVMGN